LATSLKNTVKSKTENKQGLIIIIIINHHHQSPSIIVIMVYFRQKPTEHKKATNNKTETEYQWTKTATKSSYTTITVHKEKPPTGYTLHQQVKQTE